MHISIDIYARGCRMVTIYMFTRVWLAVAVSLYSWPLATSYVCFHMTASTPRTGPAEGSISLACS